MLKPVCLITGATDGVGKATAMALARKGFTIILMARNAAKADAVTKEIGRAAGSAVIDPIIADLASLRQVREAAEAVKRKYSRLDVLINNAGIFSPRRTMTEDGFEATFQVNYLSHFLLTQALLDPLQKSNSGRIINLSSNAHNLGKFDHNNLQAEKGFSSIGAYAASKLFMLMFARELAERLRNTPITANAVHPGVVRTPMLANAKGLFKLISYFALPFAVSPEQGAATSVHLASSAEVERVSGRYFVKSRPQAIKTKFDTKEHRELLWQLSEAGVQKLASQARPTPING
jgi:NAD(P)-dependent dehydrogenase (short-subunit alcohol dehydrogenase family)